MTPHSAARFSIRALATAAFLALGLPLSTSVAQAQLPVGAALGEAPDNWVMPRTPDGRPDLQGNWTNATLTPLTRPTGQGPVLSWEEAAAIEARQAEAAIDISAASDPDRPPPAAGGTNPVCIDSSTSCYNEVYRDPGERVAVVDGEPRSSIVTFPADGRIPTATQDARDRAAAERARVSHFGQYDHPELRPIAERCLLSFGSNAGPPMLPNYWYNNNYTIVQTPDHVMIMTEMVHDARIIRIGDGPRLPANIRPWLGDSWGRWEGDTLVIETTNFHPLQQYRGYPSDNLRVIERLSLVGPETILYEFTVDDPTTYVEPWGGQLPMHRLHDLVYEYACHEGNYALPNILSGARYEERMAEPGNAEPR